MEVVIQFTLIFKKLAHEWKWIMILIDWIVLLLLLVLLLLPTALYSLLQDVFRTSESSIQSCCDVVIMTRRH